MIHISNKTYEVVADHKNGWKPDAFKERYSEVLERYDYIVGDWGYNQLRLRGFFKEDHPKATKESSIATLQDYLNEYCNFGCAYFILEKIAVRPEASAEQPVPAEGVTLDQAGAQVPLEPAYHIEPPTHLPRHQPQAHRAPDQPERSERQEKPERQARPERPERHDRQDRQERQSGRSHQAQRNHSRKHYPNHNQHRQNQSNERNQPPSRRQNQGTSSPAQQNQSQ
ncbi:YutD family protein [Paenibacillus xerothermodurans]|uniref:DUF1027 domain-containing protein n=1 Tax=Paenibacillus xerothermodurans TaxID=1977292 RepID=A0A2W1N9D4_PAEXE|nr:YutD family protein [Paenibacillus xerothermodurans]PZE21249.1 DUF1027 domain-containing protein [Paenibacillus xerothermodurans]